MTTEETYFQNLESQFPDAELGKLFGKPCYKWNKKAFCCFFQNEMVFKLDKANHTTAMELKGAHLFDPSGKGRPMKEWVQIPSDHIKLWSTYTAAALKYVQDLNK